MESVNHSRVIGVTYQDTKGKDGVLLNTPEIKVKLLDNGELTGIIFKDKKNGEETCLNGLNITGVIYQDEDSSRENILTARKVLGIIFQRREFGRSDNLKPIQTAGHYVPRGWQHRSEAARWTTAQRKNP